MSSDLPTTTTLLEGLFDPHNQTVWETFHERYRPIILAVARRIGLGAEDAADVAQETLVRFFQEYRAGKYNRERGRLRSWIVAIARYRIADIARAKARRREWRGESVLAFVEDEDRLTFLWDEECRREVLRRAMNELNETTLLDERTITAFKRQAFEERTPAEIADELGMNIDAVYKARQRCLAQLRTILLRLNAAYELSDGG